jgi:hypothetical protein
VAKYPWFELKVDPYQKENISINTICPGKFSHIVPWLGDYSCILGIVHTSIIPQEMVDAVSTEWYAADSFWRLMI